MAALLVLALAGCGGGSSGKGPAASATRTSGTLDVKGIQAALGATGESEEGVLMVDIPRDDLRFRRAGIPISADLDQSVELHFAPLGSGQALASGEIPVRQTDAPRVLASLATDRIEVTALHNHLTRLTPLVLWIHFRARGNALSIARAVRRALQVARIPLPYKQSQGAKTTLPVKALTQTIGGKAMVEDHEVVNLTIPRRRAETVQGVSVPSSFGLEADVYLQPIRKGKAASTGELPLLAPEVDPVIRVLEGAGFEVTALHNHYLDEQPRLFYLHYWATGTPARIAATLHRALTSAGFETKPGG